MSKSDEIRLKGQSFSFVKTRYQIPVSVFKNEDSYLRIGPKEILKPEVEFHKKLLLYGFPVPEIIEEGESGGKFYYIETSLGKKLFGDMFWNEYKKLGRISNKSFVNFVEVTKEFAKAQLKTVGAEPDDEGFYIGIHADFMTEELPDIKSDILRAFKKAAQNTKKLPRVLTHGDFNPYNIFPKGIIDFGSFFHAPAGYDIITCINQTYNFPKDGDYEKNLMRRYEFSNDQIKAYFVEIDKIYAQAGLQAISSFAEDFAFCRAIWSTARMQKYPKIQQWRYERFRKIVKDYLNSKTIIDMPSE